MTNILEINNILIILDKITHINIEKIYDANFIKIYFVSNSYVTFKYTEELYNKIKLALLRN